MNGSSKYVHTYNEEENIKNELENEDINLTFEEFIEIREDLIQKGNLFIDYSPHRSSTGNRSSRPARWAYKLTKPALDKMPNILLENGIPMNEYHNLYYSDQLFLRLSTYSGFTQVFNIGLVSNHSL